MSTPLSTSTTLPTPSQPGNTQSVQPTTATPVSSVSSPVVFASAETPNISTVPTTPSPGVLTKVQGGRIGSLDGAIASDTEILFPPGLAQDETPLPPDSDLPPLLSGKEKKEALAQVKASLSSRTGAQPYASKEDRAAARAARKAAKKAMREAQRAFAALEHSPFSSDEEYEEPKRVGKSRETPVSPTLDPPFNELDSYADVRVPAPTVEAIPQNRHWYSWLVDRWNGFSLKHEHKLSPEDRTRLDTATAAVESLPQRARNAISNGLDDLWSKVKGANVPTEMRQIISLIVEVIPLAITNEPNTAAVLVAGILLRNGFLTTALIAGLAIFVKQFLKRVWWAEHEQEIKADPGFVYQSGFGSEDPSTDTNADATGIESLYALIHYYTIGQIPDVTPKQVMDGLKDFNTIGHAVRHLEHFGGYLVRAFKVIVNYLTWKLTGGYLFDSEQNTVRDEWLAVTTSVHKLDQINGTVARTVSAKMTELISRAADAKMPDEVIRNMRTRYDTFIKLCQVKVPEYATAHPAPPAVMMTVYGRPGIGKNILIGLICDALRTAHGMTAPREECVMWYMPGLNFQPLVPMYPFILVVDDASLIENEQVKAELNATLASLGAGKPVVFDAASVDQKALLYADFKYVIRFENKAEDIKGVTEPDALGRRDNGGKYLLTLDPKWQKENKQLLVQPALDEIAKRNIEAVDEIWEFDSMVNRERWRFSELINALVKLSDDLAANAGRYAAALASVSQTFKRSMSSRDTAPAIDMSKTLNTLNVTQSQNKLYGYTPYRKQVLQGGDVVDFISAQHGRTPESRLALLTYLKAHPQLVSKVSTGIAIGGVPVSLSELFARVELTPAEVTADIRTPLSKWTPAHARAAAKLMFHINADNARYAEYDYISEGKRISDVFLKGTEVDFTGFCQWATHHSDNPVFYHHAFDAKPSLMTRYPLLFGFALTLTYAVVISVVVNFVTSYMAHLRPRVHHQSSYSTTAAKRAPKGALVTTFGGQLKHQSEMRPTDWLLKILEPNTMSARMYGPGQYSQCSILGFIGNLAGCVKHAFTDTGPDKNRASKLVVVGKWAGVFPIKYVDFDTVARLANCVQVIFEPDADLAWVLFPYNQTMFPSILKYLIEDDTTVDSLTQLVMARRDHYEFNFIDANGAPSKSLTDKIAPVEQKPLEPFPLGDAHAMTQYSIGETALSVDVVVPTLDGDCTQAVYTNNTRVGRGHRVLAGFLSGFAKVENRCVIVPTTHGTLLNVLKRLEGKMTKIDYQGSVVKLDPVPKPHGREDWGELMQHPIGRVTGRDVPYLNSLNSIRPSLIYHCLDGVSLTHPITGQKVPLDPHMYAPANLRDLRGGTMKMRLNHGYMTDAVMETHEYAVKRVFDQMIACCDKRLLRKRTQLFTIREAINGIPELGIPGLDMTKSFGLHPGVYKSRKEVTRPLPEGGHDLLPEYYPIVEEATQRVLDKLYDTPLVIVNLKEELRQVINDMVKVPRATQCYAFFYLIMVRRFALLLPYIMITGKVHNGMIVGADLNGRDGAIIAAMSRLFDFHVTGDLKNYDANQMADFLAPIEDNTAKLLQSIFPFISWESGLIVAMGARLVYLIVGYLVYLALHGLWSGFILTTFNNSVNISAAVVGAWNRHPDAKGDFYQHNAQFNYGDDFQAHTNTPTFTSLAIGEHLKDLKHTMTPTQKDGVIVPHLPIEDVESLKRTTLQHKNGRASSFLRADVLAHIPIWVRGKDIAPKASTTVNAEAFLREAFLWGPENFEICKSAVNTALIEAGCQPSRLTFFDLNIDKLNNFGGARTYPTVRPPTIGDPPIIGYGPIHHQSKTVSTQLGTASNRDTRSAMRVNPTSSTNPNTLDGVETQQGLTGYRDDAAKISNNLTPMAFAQLKNPLSCYPPQGIEHILGRQYLLGTVNWLKTDGPGVVYPGFPLPQSLFTPTITEKAASWKYGRFGAELEFRINGQPQSAGALGFAFIPYGQSTSAAVDYRAGPNYLPNLPGTFISANASSAVTLQLPHCAPTLYMDFQTGADVCTIGTVIPFVLVEQSWSIADPPTQLNVAVYGRLLVPQVSGNDLNAGPTALRTIASTQHYKKSDATIKHQSNVVKEGQEKSERGVLDGVSSAISTVETVIKEAGPIVDLIGMFDKPLAVAAPTPTIRQTAPDFMSAEGLTQSITFGMPTTAYVATHNNLVGEVTPVPSWDNVLGIPALLARAYIEPVTVAGALIADIKIDPTNSMLGGSSDELLIPGPLCYYSLMHTRWRGNFCYTIRCFGSSLTKATLRITYLPSTQLVSDPVPNDQIGDVESRVVDLIGDKDILVKVLYDRTDLTSEVGFPGDALTDHSSLGRLLLQVVTPLAAGTLGDIQILIYVHADKGFQLIGYKGLDSHFVPEPWYSPPPSNSKEEKGKGTVGRPVVRRSDSPVIHQASVRTLAGMEYPTLSPSTPMTVTGPICPDTTYGPISLGKRFHRYGSRADAAVQNTPFTVVPVLIGNSDLWCIAAPFAGYSGSWNFKAVLRRTAWGIGLWGAFRQTEATQLIEHYACAGVVWGDSAQDKTLSFTLPYMNRDIYKSIYPFEAAPNNFPYCISAFDPDANYDFTTFHSFGDDTAFYHFTVCPVLYNTYITTGAKRPAPAVSSATPSS